MQHDLGQWPSSGYFTYIIAYLLLATLAKVYKFEYIYICVCVCVDAVVG
jgi:hypothetical protein